MIEKEPAVPREGWLACHPMWPVTLLLVGIRLWWALGVGSYLAMASARDGLR